ncbi:MAG: hypothetical protein ABI895_03215 [Deltaproteobacteria bacterium]
MKRSSRRSLLGRLAAGWSRALLPLGALSLAVLSGCSAGGAKSGGATLGARPVSNGSGDARDVDLGGGNLLPGSGNGPDFGTELTPVPGGGEFTGIPLCAKDCTDFPEAPLFEDGLGADVEAVFKQPASGAAPCIIEPADGMLIPANMLRPRVRFTSPGNLHQITLHTEREAHDLVVYTSKNPWLIPSEIWQGINHNVYEEDITVTVKSTSGTAAPSQSSVKFRIAPVPAGGSIVYWAATTEQPGLDTTRLLAFAVGEEAVVTALRPSDVGETMLGDNGRIKRQEFGAPLGQARCVGCHTSTGDGKAVITGDHWPWNLAVSDISGGRGGRPADVTPFGAFLLQMPWLGVSSTSRGDWAAGKRIVITSATRRPAMNEPFTPNPNTPHQDMGFGQRQTEGDGLLWINLAAEGTVPPLEGDQYEKGVGTAMLAARGTGGWGVIARTGDPGGAVTPDWSHDGKTIAYTSTNGTSDGRIGDNASVADIYTVPYAGGLGGPAAPLPGASTPDVGEYYPDFSADDRFIAFTRVQDRQGRRYYYHDRGEIYVVPATGGTPTRLAANDPPLCSGESSPGVLNSWPKWSPTVRSAPEASPSAGKKYYFVLFSSARQSPFRLGQGPASQLYMATVVEQPNGELLTYPAMYLWNQTFEITNPDAENPTPVQTSNLTPAFDEFLIPPRPAVIVR